MKSYIKDYPRPQLVRDAGSWENLNGKWDFAFDDENIGVKEQWYNNFPKQTEIVVPFTYETKASGIGDEAIHEHVWYKRAITVDKARPSGERVVLHFEGSDYETQLWVNGIYCGNHTGGYSRFSFDITDALNKEDNSIAVRITDKLDERQPRGKQRWRKESFGCWYVQTTGIWKTVWLERRAQTHIKNIKLTPNITSAVIELECDIEANVYNEKLLLEATVTFKDEFINRITMPVMRGNVHTAIDVYKTENHQWGVHLWAPHNPQLYDIELRLIEDNNCCDRVLSYFGMREIRIDGSNVLLNGHPIYQRLILDQGYWNESHLTPPSEEALIEDIDKIMKLGYNGLRKHQKIEDERFLYWCDVKGMLVWSEMASAYQFDDYSVQAFMKEWTEVVLQNYNHPSIITWTPVNESWGVREIKTVPAQQNFTQAIYHLTKSLDPYRPVIVNDGWEHTVSDIITLHDYEENGDYFIERYIEHFDKIMNAEQYHNNNKSAFADGFGYDGQPIIISEYGGIAYNNDDSGWGYGNKVNTKEQFIERFDSITTAIKKLPYCCGFCYTQVTDVQSEINGLMDIDRNYKADPEKIREINIRRVSAFHR